jgi:hypothetical protein
MNTTDTAVDTMRADTPKTVSGAADATRHNRVRWPRRWPLAMLAAPAGVATWSGWVGLGGLTGFGMVRPLPGIADGFTINSAITLPIGVEAYAAYAMSAWLTSAPVSNATRAFARRSAIAALVLGMLGQVAYHLLVSKGAAHAPWLITTAVASLPVLVLGAGASLAHMLHRDRSAVSDTPPGATADTVPDTTGAVSAPVSSAASDTVQNTVTDTVQTVSSTAPEPVSNTTTDTAQNTTTNTTPTRTRKPAKRRGAPVSRHELARQIYDTHMDEHGSEPAVAEMMRQLKDAGHPTGNKTAASLLDDIRRNPLRLAQAQ